MGFDDHIIYHVHIEKQNRVIRVKDLRIFEDTETKHHTILPSYKDGKPTFQSFLLDDNDEKETSNAPNNSTTIQPNIPTDTGKLTASKDAAKPKVPKDTSKLKSSHIVNQDKKSRYSQTIKPIEKAKGQNQELIAYLIILLKRD